MFHTTRNADGIWYLTKANNDGNGYEVISTHATEDDANDAMREQEDAAKSAISAGLLCYMIRTEVANGATLAEIAEKSGQPVNVIADVLNNGTPLTRAEAIAEMRGTLAPCPADAAAACHRCGRTDDLDTAPGRATTCHPCALGDDLSRHLAANRTT